MPKRRVTRHEVCQPLAESYRFIPLTRRKNAIVDAADFEWLSQWNWCAHWTGTTFYARRSQRRPTVRRIYMHREILKLVDGMMCDHVNHNTLDNRRANIRRASASENGSNRVLRSDNLSGFKGVSWDVDREKWFAKVSFAGVQIPLGRFTDKVEAARAYDEAARKYHGEFAVLNFP